MGAVTLSPGAIPEKLTSAEVGLEEISTLPVENAFDATATESEKMACVRAHGAPATTPTASRAIHTFRIEKLPSSGCPIEDSPGVVVRHLEGRVWIATNE
jgi:hypothetical protein